MLCCCLLEGRLGGDLVRFGESVGEVDLDQRFLVLSAPSPANMKLYILGPAFGLPSIDPGCNAAVALLRALEETVSWEVTISHDEDSTLPRLEDGGSTYYGLKSIIDHLKERAPALSARQETDQTAYSRPMQSKQSLG